MADKIRIVQVEVSRCPCGSTRRSGYYNVKTTEGKGTDDKGRPYTHVKRRYCRCLKCQQVRVDRSCENRGSIVPRPMA
jgi:hypothetical protein